MTFLGASVTKKLKIQGGGNFNTYTKAEAHRRTFSKIRLIASGPYVCVFSALNIILLKFTKTKNIHVDIDI